MRRWHLFAGIGRCRARQNFRLQALGIAFHIEANARFAMRRIRAMTHETMVGKNRPNVAIKLHLLRGHR